MLDADCDGSGSDDDYDDDDDDDANGDDDDNAGGYSFGEEELSDGSIGDSGIHDDESEDQYLPQPRPDEP